MSYVDCYKRSVANLRAVGKAAAKKEVVACVENVWNRFLYSPLEFKQFLKDVGHKNVAMYLDIGNVWNFGYPQDWIEIIGKQIARVHVKDFRRTVGNANGLSSSAARRAVRIRLTVDAFVGKNPAGGHAKSEAKARGQVNHAIHCGKDVIPNKFPPGFHGWVGHQLPHGALESEGCRLI